MVTITDVPLVTNCNEFVVELRGTWSLVADLTGNFSAEDAFDLATYTDGYQVQTTQTITATPESAGTTQYGMCFGVVDPESDTTSLGAFCVSYLSASGKTDAAEVDSRIVNYWSASDWSDTTYTSTAKTNLLTVADNGLNDDPNVTGILADLPTAHSEG